MICAVILIFFVPESPKFTFSQGDEERTLKILQQIHYLNVGIDNYPVRGIIKDEEFGESGKRSEGFFKFMYTQSVPLFQGKHLRNILTACFLQFSVCNTSNGFWTFLPEILNKNSIWVETDRGSATLCEIFHSTDLVRNSTADVSVCVQKLEVGTFVHIYEIVILYGVCYAVMSLSINRIGKLAILLVITLSCCVSAFLLIFVTIPELSSYLYLLMILAGLSISVVNASTVELFPTKMR